MGLLSRALKSSQRGEQRDHEAKKVNAASARTIICRTVTGGARMKVGNGLGWPCHHLAHPAHPRYAHCARQQQHDKVKTFARVRRLSAIVTWKYLGTVSPTAQQLLCRDCARWDRVVWLRRGCCWRSRGRRRVLARRRRKGAENPRRRLEGSAQAVGHVRAQA